MRAWRRAETTRSVQRAIGERRAPQPNEWPGYIRVDNVGSVRAVAPILTGGSRVASLVENLAGAKVQ